MTRLILIRHGQTEWNRVERFRGMADLALDEVGIRQAEATAERVMEWPVAAVYTSPLKRAIASAGIIARRFGLQPEVHPGLIDINFGEWEGLSPKEAAVKDPKLWSTWVHSPHLARFPGGEALGDVTERASAVVDEVVGKHEGGTVAMVSHRVVCHLLVLHLLGLDESRFWHVTQDVSTVNVFEHNEMGWFVVALNDTCHLKGLKTHQSGVYKGDSL
ncbi:MAG: histidine phosphatase family protein [Chloroflexota bacterium]